MVREMQPNPLKQQVQMRTHNKKQATPKRTNIPKKTIFFLI